ncbi:hypothetical protein [Puniceibacterium confluentis]|uniref:hypothetical protein n=1 Tax=Puniceibacterium confluentis TaxID=1958944 RepID=UPI0011B3E8A3|nr:hypothetical protein [Puniceibacterium confluentis]
MLPPPPPSAPRRGNGRPLPRIPALARLAPVLPLATLAAAALTVSAAAQSYDTGGLQLTFGLLLRSTAEDNRALEPDSAGPSTTAQTHLSLGLLSETRSERLAFDIDGTLRALDTPGGTAAGSALTNPGLALSYGRSSVGARLGLEAALRETDLSENRLDADGLNQVSGTATRRRGTAGVSLNWGDDAPLGFGLLARVEDTTYRDGTATGTGNSTLDDSRRRTLGATTRIDLGPVQQLDLGLTWSDFDLATLSGRRETVTLDSTLTLARPRGATSVNLTLTSTEEGDRIATSLGQSLALPSGQLSGQIGATRSAEGGTYMTGGLDLRHELARSTLSLGLSRSVTSSDTTDGEQLSTRAALSYSRELPPVGRIRVGLNLLGTEQTATGAQTLGTEFGLSYSRDLPQDWTVAAGYTHRFRDEDGTGAAQSNRIFLELRRDFVSRF